MAGTERIQRDNEVGDRYLPGEIIERPAAPETNPIEKFPQRVGTIAVEGREAELRRNLGRVAVEGRDAEIRRALGRRAIQERSDAPGRDRG